MGSTSDDEERFSSENMARKIQVKVDADKYVELLNQLHHGSDGCPESAADADDPIYIEDRIEELEDRADALEAMIETLKGRLDETERHQDRNPARTSQGVDQHPDVWR